MLLINCLKEFLRASFDNKPGSLEEQQQVGELPDQPERNIAVSSTHTLLYSLLTVSLPERGAAASSSGRGRSTRTCELTNLIVSEKQSTVENPGKQSSQ